ncbi:UNVERIFIED_CONTAM: putative chloride channel-like protein CLC-g [Sesamum radiatum]|uniref:Chloride channel-like protein CLC-g n=1 Tax=Sesamum radiatum TaxID=300843 RepID=A0AAW2NQX6_SESRA
MMLPALPNGMEPAADEESSEVLREPLLLLQDQRSRSNTTSQVAIVGSDLCPIESLDYEIIENDFFKQDWRTMGTVDIFQYILSKWTLCFLIGVIVSLLGFLNNLAIENIAGVKFVITSNMMLARKFVVAFVVFASSNLGLTFLSSLVTALIAPEAAGSGIPEVKAYLNGVDAPAIFSFRTLVVKVLLSTHIDLCYWKLAN